MTSDFIRKTVSSAKPKTSYHNAETCISFHPGWDEKLDKYKGKKGIYITLKHNCQNAQLRSVPDEFFLHDLIASGFGRRSFKKTQLCQSPDKL